MKYIALCQNNVILKKNQQQIEPSDFEKLKDKNPIAEFFVEKSNDMSVLVLSSQENLPDDYYFMTLREFYSCHDEVENFLAYRAKALFGWHQETKFCGACGTKLIPHEVLTAMKCPNCGREIFPRISPCVIVVVSREDKVLLVRHSYRNQDVYGLVAGFVEAGESAEAAVRRELLEETGIKVKNIQYRGSQSWPFPDQMMLGYTADYESGDLVLQEEEIAEAGWFDKNNLPLCPKAGSIAYRLIHGEY